MPQEQEMDEDSNFSATEEMAHNKAREIAVAVLGPLANPDKPEDYKPSFSVIHEIRNRCICMSEDEDEFDDDETEKEVVQLRFVIARAQEIAAGVPLTVDDAIKAFDAFTLDYNLENKVDELMEMVEKLLNKKR